MLDKVNSDARGFLFNMGIPIPGKTAFILRRGSDGFSDLMLDRWTNRLVTNSSWRHATHCDVSVLCFQPWDRTHLLENLAGLEADCAMAGQSNWQWATATKFASQQGFNMETATAVAPNEGNVEEALRIILQDIKDNHVSRVRTTFGIKVDIY